MNETIEIYGIHFTPLMPAVYLIILSVLSFLIIILTLFLKGRGTIYRLVLLSALLVILAGPSLVSETRTYLKDTVLVLVDETDSQQIGNRKEQTRIASKAVFSKLQTIKNLNVQTVVVKNQTTTSDEVDGSNLFAARDNALKSIPQSQLAGTIFITDGQIHDVPPVGTPDITEAGPIHVLLTGEENEKDRILQIESSPPYGIVNKTVVVKLKVIDQNVDDIPQSVIVTAKLDDRIIRQLALRTGDTVDLEIEILHGGQNFLEIRTAPLEGEISVNNNVAFLTINGIRDRLKVLLVSGEPHMGERGWRNILKSDPSVDLVHFTILRPPEKQDGTPINELSLIPFPIAELFERKLNEFDLIIFDRYRRRGVLAPTYLRNIVKYVEKGGALLEAAGPSFATPLSLYRTPLSSILPGKPTGTVFEQGFIPTLSNKGTRHPVTSRLSSKEEQKKWGRWFRMIDTEPKAGDTLMTGPEERPLLILQRQGEGRVAQLMSDQAWLWGRGFEGGGPQAELLRRVSHWLMKEPELEEEQLSGKVAGDSLTIEKRSLSDRNESVLITYPDGKITSVLLPSIKPGIQRGSIGLSGMGLYRLNTSGHSALVAVGPLNPIEIRDARSTKELVEKIVKKTKGGIHRLISGTIPDFKRTDPSGIQATKFWLGLRNNKNYEITGYNRISLVPPLLAFSLLIGMLCLAWWRESR